MKSTMTRGAAVLALAAALGAAGCKQTAKPAPDATGAKTITVLCPKIFAAAMKEAKPLFERAHPGFQLKLEVQLLAPMRRDILKGKVGDVFLSMGDTELGPLYAQALAERKSATAFAGNPLVLLARPGNPLALKSLKDLASAKVKGIAVPDPKSNSAGAAFVQAARKAGIYEKVKGRLRFGKGPRSATALMEAGKADANVTHLRCFGGHAKKNALVMRLGADHCTPVVSKAVILTSAKNPAGARKLLAFMRTAEFQRLLPKYNLEKVSR